MLSASNFNVALLLCGQFITAFLFVWIPLTAVYLILRNRKTLSLVALIGAISAACLFSYLVFLTAWLELISGVQYLLDTFVVTIFVISIWTIKKSVRRICEIQQALCGSFLLGLVTLVTGLSKGIVDNDLGAQHTVAVRYWASVDNKIPGFLARGILNEMPMKPYLFADWKGSDRPPLVSGWLCISKALLNSKYGEIALLIAASTLLVPLVCVLLAIFKVSQKYWLAIAVVVFSTPFAFTNAVYTWPKIVAGLLFLLSISIFWIDEVPNKYWLIGMTFVLGFLAHGSTLFMLFGFIYIALKKRTTISNYLRMVFAAVLCYAPWFYFQQYWDRSSNRLIYWHISGLNGGSTGEGIVNTTIHRYLDMSISEVIQNKVDNFSNLIFFKDRNPAIAGLKGFPGQVNAWASETILGSLWPLAISALICFLFRRKWNLEIPRSFLVGISIGLIAFILLEFGHRPDSIASAHIAPLSIVIFIGVVLAGYVMATIGAFDRSGLLTSVIVFLFLLINYANYGLVSGVNAAEGGSGGSLNYSLALLWLVSSLTLAGLTKKGFLENEHINSPDNRLF